MRSGTEITSEKDKRSNEMPRWLEATSSFLKSSGPEFPTVYGGKIIQYGGGGWV